MNAFYRLCLPGNRISVLALSRVLCSFTSHLKRRLGLDPPNHINLVKWNFTPVPKQRSEQY